MRQNHRITATEEAMSRNGNRNFHLNVRKTALHVRVTERCHQKGGEVSFSGDVQEPPGCCPVHPAVHPAVCFSRRLDYMISGGPFHPNDSVMLWR